MHYKNGREAHESDPVICRDYNGKITVGQIHNLRPGATCNCDVSVLVPGGTQQLTCRTVGEMYHAEDAFAAAEMATAATAPSAQA